MQLLWTFYLLLIVLGFVLLLQLLIVLLIVLLVILLLTLLLLLLLIVPLRKFKELFTILFFLTNCKLIFFTFQIIPSPLILSVLHGTTVLNTPRQHAGLTREPVYVAEGSVWQPDPAFKLSKADPITFAFRILLFVFDDEGCHFFLFVFRPNLSQCSSPCFAILKLSWNTSMGVCMRIVFVYSLQ